MTHVYLSVFIKTLNHLIKHLINIERKRKRCFTNYDEADLDLCVNSNMTSLFFCCLSLVLKIVNMRRRPACSFALEQVWNWEAMNLNNCEQ